MASSGRMSSLASCDLLGAVVAAQSPTGPLIMLVISILGTAPPDSLAVSDMRRVSSVPVPLIELKKELQRSRVLVFFLLTMLGLAALAPQSFVLPGTAPIAKQHHHHGAATVRPAVSVGMMSMTAYNPMAVHCGGCSDAACCGEPVCVRETATHLCDASAPEEDVKKGCKKKGSGGCCTCCPEGCNCCDSGCNCCA